MADLSLWDQQITIGSDGPRQELKIVALKDGSFVAVWKQTTDGDSDIFTQVYNADGTTKSQIIQVNILDTKNDGTPSGQEMPVVTALANGGFAVAWVDHSSSVFGSDIRGRIFDANGTPSPNDFFSTLTIAGNQSRPDIAAYNNGYVVSALHNSTTGPGVTTTILDATGTRIREFKIDGVFESHSVSDTINAPIGARYRGLFITAALSEGASNSADTIHLRAHSADTDEDIGTINVGEGAKSVSVTALADGRFVVTWKEEPGFGAVTIKAIIYSADGDSSEIKILASSSAGIEDPVIAALPNGGFALAYERNGDIRAQTHDADGNTVGGPIFVHTDLEGEQTKPSITVLPDGRFIVGWESLQSAVPTTHGQIMDSRDAQDWHGGAGGDSFVGTIYADTLDGGTGNDTLYGAQGKDTLVGGEGADSLMGGAGDDRLFGGAGADTFSGGADFDIVEYAGATSGVVVDLENRGNSQGDAKGDIFEGDVEGVGGTAHGDWLTSNHRSHELYGNGGDDVLEGRGGNDRLEGGQGNDLLFGGEGNDTLDGGAGADTAMFAGRMADYTINRTPDANGYITVSHANGTGEEGIDKLKDVRILKFFDGEIALTNAAPTNLTLSKSSIQENAPNGAEVGTLSARDADGDALTYSLLPGSSSAFAIVGNKLVVNGPLDFESKLPHQVTIRASDRFGGTTSLTVNLTVTNEVENTPFTLWGTPGADVLTGENGNDTIYGSGGNDVLSGLGGDDRIHGGAGKDMLTGGAGKDVFVFDTRANKRTNVDKITDFRSQDDSIWLENKYFTKLGSGSVSKPKKFKADMFTTGTKAKDAEDRIVYDKKTGKLYYDQDGTGAKAQILIATLTNKATLKYHDFFVI